MGIGDTDREWIEQQVRHAGFDLAGVAAVPAEGTPAGAEASRRFAAWVAAGRAGEMEWLKRTDAAGELIRGDLHRSMPWARSVVVCAINYNPDAVRSIDAAPSGSGWIARYAWSGRAHDTYPGSDYHEVLLAKLRAVEQALRDRFGPEIQTRCYVDTGPIVEREYAQRAGIGWIGKNTCVLNERLGSWLLLGVIITSLDFAPETWALPAADRCGTCTQCIDACPTNALTPREMDATRCISYLTIEKKGAIDESLRAPIGRQVFGCDICQDVCPWNRGVERRRGGEALPREATPHVSLVEWLRSDPDELRRRFARLYVPRNDGRRLRLNALVAAGNVGGNDERSAMTAFLDGPDETTREVAVWTLRRMEERDA